MKDNLQQSLISIIEDAIKSLGFSEGNYKQLGLDFPTDKRFGDLSSNVALKLSKSVKKESLEIAQNLVNAIREKLKDNAVNDYIKEVKVEGAGFVNFYLKEKYFYEQLKNLIAKGKRALSINIGKDKKVLIEFVSANPTGPLSVAHARQAVVGDCLAKILDFLGFKVRKEYYLNDEGNQIYILAQSLELRLRELDGEKIDFPDNYYKGNYIYDIAKEVKKSLSAGRQEKSKVKNLQEFVVKYILDIIKKDLNDFGVRFDYWYSQKELNKSGKITEALNLLKKEGLLIHQDGALWFKSTNFGDDKDRVVIKSDGSYTYLAPDIAYHLEKYRRGFTWLINLWGPDHHGYIKRLKAVAQAFGRPEESLSIIIVQLASIFKDGRALQMSTRSGQYITLREILDAVGRDASRFFFLMRRVSSHLDFDLDIAKQQTPENPVYYVQYAHARICSILRQSHIKNFKKNFDPTLLKEKEEIDLIKKLLQFSYILNICLATRDPYMITVYLKEVAESFHKFYDLHRVLGEYGVLTCARLSLIEATRIIIREALELLGISAPEQM